MNAALLSLVLPLGCGLGLLLFRSRSGWWVVASSVGSVLAAALSLRGVVTQGNQQLALGGWQGALAVQLEQEPVSGMLMLLTALIHLLVALYALRSRHSHAADHDFWPLSSLLHASLAALWLSRDLFNWYICLELLGLVAVSLVMTSGARAYASALQYLLLSIAASGCYLLGVTLLYGRYGVLDLGLLAEVIEMDRATHTALVLITLGLMVKGALWPLHLWLPRAHAGAPTAVSALLSGLVVKGPLFILWLIWSRLAPAELAAEVGIWFACAGLGALLIGGWSAFRTPYIKMLPAYSTVAQLGYAMLALGLLLRWQQPSMTAALWLFILAHALAKASLFLLAGEMQESITTRRVARLVASAQSMPVALFGFALAGGSLIGLPPSGGFVAKWLMLREILRVPEHWPWAVGLLLGTLATAAYILRIAVLSVSTRRPPHELSQPDTGAQWLALLPALCAWLLALWTQPLMAWLERVA
ncbi:complex I subunit 5 family protein [Pseudomonas sp.]|uniref:complex I subunit 5 family protein n=1 Tax=Pseudomonas sp. TaxID=306 RepID=UPI00272C636A|nr:proton-conducting transporter membrane subunit [Pseudomonas sp.]